MRAWSTAGALGGVALLLCCAGAAKRAPDVLPPEPLPSVFRGVTWTTTSAELKALLPAADVTEPVDWACEDGSRCVTWHARAPGWPAFGHAQVALSGRAGESARLIDLVAFDPRDGCRDGSTAPRPSDCVDAPGSAMDRAFARMRKLLEAQLGPGKRWDPRDVAEGARPPVGGERSTSWKRRGYDLSLGVFEGDDGWYLQVQAFRGW